tara:strand:+ start:18162 stop:18383 length:222 start_codon:yes stop_codon:yes gene_type:complete
VGSLAESQVVALQEYRSKQKIRFIISCLESNIKGLHRACAAPRLNLLFIAFCGMANNHGGQFSGTFGYREMNA